MQLRECEITYVAVFKLRFLSIPIYALMPNPK